MINTDAMYSSKHMCQFEFQVGKTELTEKISAGTVYQTPLIFNYQRHKRERNKTIT